MARWEYAELSNPASGKDSVAFSHMQRATLVDDYKAHLGRGLKADNSTRAYLHLNLNNAAVIGVAGLLGDEGWELVSHAALTGGHEYLMFKRELPPKGG